jgi:hypothetical protein
VSDRTCFVSGNLGVGVAHPKSALAVFGNAIATSNVGIGEIFLNSSPSYSLQLSRDSAAKPSTSMWTVTSDRRIKTGIVDADVGRCYDIIRGIPLRRFSWRDDIYSSGDVFDRTKLGWIAQEVEKFFPKAVESINQYGIEDCKTLNIDQLMAAMYGCMQFMQSKIEDMQIDIACLLKNYKS